MLNVSMYWNTTLGDHLRTEAFIHTRNIITKLLLSGVMRNCLLMPFQLIDSSKSSFGIASWQMAFEHLLVFL